MPFSLFILEYSPQIFRTGERITTNRNKACNLVNIKIPIDCNEFALGEWPNIADMSKIHLSWTWQQASIGISLLKQHLRTFQCVPWIAGCFSALFLVFGSIPFECSLAYHYSALWLYFWACIYISDHFSRGTAKSKNSKSPVSQEGRKQKWGNNIQTGAG